MKAVLRIYYKNDVSLGSEELVAWIKAGRTRGALPNGKHWDDRFTWEERERQIAGSTGHYDFDEYGRLYAHALNGVKVQWVHGGFQAPAWVDLSRTPTHVEADVYWPCTDFRKYVLGDRKLSVGNGYFTRGNLDVGVIPEGHRYVLRVITPSLTYLDEFVQAFRAGDLDPPEKPWSDS